MTRTMRILTFLMLAVVVGTGQTWGRGGLGYIVFDDSEVTNKGEVTFYTDANCEHAIDFSGGRSGNLTSEALTAVKDGANNIIGYTVYIKAVPNYDYTLGAADNNGAVTFITAEKTTNVFQAPRRTQSDPTLNLGPDITVKATSERFVYSFTMPANGANVTIHVDFPKRAKQSVKYIDVDGELKDSPEAYFIDGSETALSVPGDASPWYVVPAGSVSYACSLPCVGNVNLILADGATMAIGTKANPVTGNGLYNDEGSISIYGQSQKTGKLTAYAVIDGVYASSGNIIINGCEVTAEGYTGIYAADGALTINGGEVTATGEHEALYAIDDITLTDAVVIAKGDYSGITSELSDIIINGGNVTATSTKQTDGHALFVPSGGGKIVITATDTEIENNNHITVSGYEGIYTGTGNISINGFTVQATGLANAIYASSGDISLTNADVTATAANAYAIHAADGKLTISGGTVNAAAKATETGYGLYASGDIQITGNCQLKAFNGDHGIYSENGGLTIDGSTVTATSTQGNGLNANGKIEIKNSKSVEGMKVIASGKYGILSEGENSDVTINGVNVEATGTSNDGISAKVISLTGAKVTASGVTSGINATDGALTIISSDVTAASTATDTNGYGLYAYNGVIVKTDDNETPVKVNATGKGGYSAISAGSGDITLTNADITATAENAYAISAEAGALTIEGGKVNATANTDETTGSGLFAEGSISVTDGCELTAIGINYGINSENGGLTIDGSTVTATSTQGNGLNANGKIEIKNSKSVEGMKVTATGRYGISSEGENSDVTVTGGEVEAIGSSDDGISAKVISLTGAKVTASGVTSGINATDGALTIISSDVTAASTATDTNGYGLYAYNGVIVKTDDNETPVKVNATGKGGYSAISAGSGDITLTNADITATAEKAYAIYAEAGALTIEGGTVNATATGSEDSDGYGLYADGNINISWTNETTDFITASSYDGTIVVADGQHFRAVSGEKTVAIIDGTVNDVDVLASLAGSTLKPLEGIVVSTDDAKVTLSGDPTHYAGENGIHYYIYEASAANTEILLGYGDIDAGKSVTYALTKTGTDEKVGLTASYENAQCELVNRQGKDASFTLPVPAHDVTIATNINPFLQPGGYCGDVLIDTSVTPIEITDYSKNVWWIVSDIDNVRTVTIVRGEDEHNDIIDGAVGCPWSSYVATVAVIPSGMTDIGKLGLLEHGIACDEIILILVDNMDVYKDYIQNSGDIDYSQKEKFAPRTYDITVPKGWGTYCQSYPVGYSLSTAATPYTISGIENNAVSVAAAASVAPYTPVLINNTNETEVVTLTAVPSTAGDGAGSGFLGKQEGTGYNFYGNPYDVVLTNDDIKSFEKDFDDESVDYIFAIGASDAYQSYGLYNGDFYAVDDASRGIAGHRCWLNVAKPITSAPRLSIVQGDGEMTGIDSISTESGSQGVFGASAEGNTPSLLNSLDRRNLSGQRVGAGYKGIVIVNGRKVVIK